MENHKKKKSALKRSTKSLKIKKCPCDCLDYHKRKKSALVASQKMKMYPYGESQQKKKCSYGDAEFGTTNTKTKKVR